MAESMRAPGDLDRALLDLAGHLAYPPTPDIAGGVRHRLANQTARPRSILGLPHQVRRVWTALAPIQRRLAVALLVLVAVAGAVAAVSPDARTAIAERLGLLGVQIQHVPAVSTPLATLARPSPSANSETASAGTRLNLGQLTTLDQARARLAFPIQVPAALGPPDEVYVLDGGGDSRVAQVALVYHPRSDLPEASGTGVGLLLTVFRGNGHSTDAIRKGLSPGTNLEEVRVGNGRGYWIDGDPHTLLLFDARGQLRTQTMRLAGSVLVWEQGNLTFRLESGLSKAAALQVAMSMP